jgi:ATP adenylyltransferase
VKKRGALWRAVTETAARARESGALTPIHTESEVIEDGGIAFTVRILAQRDRKAAARKEQDRTGQNPFLPYDPNLFVADISDTHLGLLNKFYVLDQHLLIVTREFEHQQASLTLRDFEALVACLDEVEGLGFYNAGTIAGASQEHKHLQLAPFPLGAGPEPMPIGPVLEEMASSAEVVVAPALHFDHAFMRFEEAPGRAPTGARLLAAYRELLAAVGIEGGRAPYNLLVTTDWMLVVPRSRESIEGISVNALGFAGSLLVRTRGQLELVRRRGPMRLLQAMAGRHPAAGTT